MRKLIQQMPYERPLAAGRYVYTEDGVATGATEDWHLSVAMDDYRFLRVDLNAGETSGDHVLYHLVLDGSGRPERLKYHLFRKGLQIMGDLLFEDALALLSRNVNAQKVASEAPFAQGTAFWFPASAGLSLLGGIEAETAALTLNRAKNLALWPTSLTLSAGAVQIIAIMGRQRQARAVTARWEDEERIIWFDEHQWPVRVQRGTLTATESRYVRYTGET